MAGVGHGLRSGLPDQGSAILEFLLVEVLFRLGKHLQLGVHGGSPLGDR